MISCKQIFPILILYLVGLNPLLAAGRESQPPAGQNAVPAHQKLEFLIKLANKQIEAGDKQAIYTADSAGKLADSLHLENEKARVFNLQGVAWKIWGDNQKSVFYLFKAKEIFNGLNRQSEYAEVLMNLGETSRAAGSLIKSMSYLKSALTIFREKNDSVGLAKVYNRLAATSYEQNLTWHNRDVDQFDVLGTYVFDFTQTYHSDKNFRMKYDSILYYAGLSNQYARKLKLPTLEISTQIIIAALYTITFQFEKALGLYDTILEESKLTPSGLELPLAYYNIAILYYKKQDYKKVLEYANECYRLSKEADIKSYIMMSAGLIGLTYTQTGQYREAYEYSRIAYLGRLEYFQQDVDMKVKTLQYDFEIERKQKQLDNRNLHLRFLYFALFSILSVTTLFIFILFLKNKRKKILNDELNKRNRIISEQNTQLALINSEKDRFFSIIAHDLRGPFNGFLGLTQTMAEELPSMSLEEIQNIAILLRHSATNLFSLLENLLTWSRLQRGLTSFSPLTFLLKPQFELSLQSILGIAQKKEIRITHEIPGDLVVFADVNMLESIFRNLISNAVKFTPPGGQVSITARPADGNSVEISIRDTGIGMNSGILQNLFKPDGKANRKGTGNEPSTGLGLIICKEFVEKHHGKIWVESMEGVGTTFYVLI
ncbi:MAG: tetratricopeptide repeat-containing sensor histidine kinase [Bacteroidota bacterium]